MDASRSNGFPTSWEDALIETIRPTFQVTKYCILFLITFWNTMITVFRQFHFSLTTCYLIQISQVPTGISCTHRTLGSLFIHNESIMSVWYDVLYKFCSTFGSEIPCGHNAHPWKKISVFHTKYLTFNDCQDLGKRDFKSLSYIVTEQAACHTWYDVWFNGRPTTVFFIKAEECTNYVKRKIIVIIMTQMSREGYYENKDI